jgi:hypothetical protein
MSACETMAFSPMTDDPETIALRPTIIAGTRYPNDYGVVWRGLTIGRIMKADGMPAHAPQWRWTCNVYGKPGGAGGAGADLDDCKAAFKAAWGRIREGLTDADIAHAHEVAETSREALARYQQRRPV